MVQHLAAYTSPGDDPVEELAEDYVETGETAQVDRDPEPSGSPENRADRKDGAVGG